jgi:hypothetical protein
LSYILAEMSRIAKERRMHLFDVMSEAFEYYIDYCDRQSIDAADLTFDAEPEEVEGNNVSASMVGPSSHSEQLEPRV